MHRLIDLSEIYLLTNFQFIPPPTRRATQPTKWLKWANRDPPGEKPSKNFEPKSGQNRLINTFWEFLEKISELIKWSVLVENRIF